MFYKIRDTDRSFNDAMMETIGYYLLKPSEVLADSYAENRVLSKLVFPEYETIAGYNILSEKNYWILKAAYEALGQFKYHCQNPANVRMIAGKKEIYIGQIKQGSFIRHGIGMVITNIDFYEGYWKDGAKHYFGRYVYMDDFKVERGYCKDKPHGKEEYLWNNGKKSSGYNNHGVKVGVWENVDADGNITKIEHKDEDDVVFGDREDFVIEF